MIWKDADIVMFIYVKCINTCQELLEKFFSKMTDSLDELVDADFDSPYLQNNRLRERFEISKNGKTGVHVDGTLQQNCLLHT